MNEFDLTPYSNKELSLVMFNTPHLYSGLMRIVDSNSFSRRDQIIDFIKDQGYIYRDDQWDFFKNDLLSHYDELRTQTLVEQLKQAQKGL
jgi:hypothetical protein